MKKNYVKCQSYWRRDNIYIVFLRSVTRINLYYKKTERSNYTLYVIPPGDLYKNRHIPGDEPKMTLTFDLCHINDLYHFLTLLMYYMILLIYSDLYSWWLIEINQEYRYWRKQLFVFWFRISGRNQHNYQQRPHPLKLSKTIQTPMRWNRTEGDVAAIT